MPADPTIPPGDGQGRGSPFAALGRHVVRHPRSVILLWIVVVVVCILPASNLGSVISNSFDNPLPSSDESVRSQNLFNEQFPHAASSPSSSIILLESPQITGPFAKNATLAVTEALRSDHALRNVSSVLSLYDAYTGYLIGQAQLGWSFLGPAISGPASLPAAVNLSATALWGPEASYLQHWDAAVANLTPGSPKSAADWPAFQATLAEYPNGSLGYQVLTDFYQGLGALSIGFNQSIFSGCLSTQVVSGCVDTAVRATVLSALPALFPDLRNRSIASATVSELSLQNWSDPAAQRAVVTQVLGTEVGLAPGWLRTLWETFPSPTPPNATALAAWAGAVVVQNPVDRFPLPIPPALYASFVNAAGSATLILVSFNVADNYTANGTAVTYADVSQIQHDLDVTLGGSSPFRGIAYYQTGSAPLNSATNYLATSALNLLLVLTIIVLLVIMLLYFRAPAAPALSFGLIGIAMTASLAVMWVIGTWVTPFNPEVQPVVLVFLMSIGTDYSVFLLARYREELVRGTPPARAVETTVRWAGQSITTSGLTVMVVTVALSLSGISFLSEMGDALFFTVLIALLVNLTLLPAILLLVGPRILWPSTGARFARYAEARRERFANRRDYIARAGEFSTRRPLAVIGVIALISAPVVFVALQVPVSYDVTNIGLPASEPAQVGYAHLSQDFGAGYTSPSYALVTFRSPLMTPTGPNASEMADLVALAGSLSTTPGIASVDTLVGGHGVPLATWLNFSTLPPAVAIQLNQSLSSYVGTDGRTVLINLATNSSGFSADSIGVLDALHARTGAFASAHPEVRQVVFGGAAPVTKDVKALVDQANQRMLLGAAIGLFVMLLIILGSAFVPLLALGAIGLAILWGWASTYFVVGILEKEALIFLLPLILLILVLGLGMDYSVLLLTRVREERLKGLGAVPAIREAVTHAGGVITAAAVILGGAFLLLGLTSPLGLLAGIGLGIGIAVLLQAFVVQTYLTPAVLTLGKDWIWRGWGRPVPAAAASSGPADPPTGPEPP